MGSQYLAKLQNRAYTSPSCGGFIIFKKCRQFASPDGFSLASGCRGSVFVFVVLTGTRSAILPHDTGGLTPRITYLSFVLDKRHLVLAVNRTICLWSIPSKEVQQRFSGRSDVVSRSGVLLGSADADGTVRLWETKSGACIQELFCYGVTNIALSPDARFLAAASFNKMIRVYSISDSVLLESLTSHRDRVVSVRFTSDGAEIISGSVDGTIKVWLLSERTQRPATSTGSRLHAKM